MVMINDFKDLDCWKKARVLVSSIYSITGKEPFSDDFGLKGQIQRASISVMANIAEGFGGSSKLEFARFLSMSIRSAYEVESHAYAALDIGYINQEEFKEIEKSLKDCIYLTKALIKYLKSKT